MKKITPWLPALLWMALIFAMSAAPGEVSGEQSGRLLELLIAVYGFFFGDTHLPPQALYTLETLLRKAAHMSEYAVLALLYAHALRQNGAKRPLRYALLLCVCYAATDELHQAFVPDRGPALFDVGVDTAGACIGLAFGRLWGCIRRR